MGRHVGSAANAPAVTTLSGRVRDEGGRPVAQAVVTLGRDSTLTGGDGAFVLRAAPGA